MTGVGGAIGLGILYVLILLFYIPTVSLIALIEMRVFKRLTKGPGLIAYALTFVGLTLITLAVIKLFPFVSFNFLVAYAILLTIILTVNYFKQIRNKRFNQ